MKVRWVLAILLVLLVCSPPTAPLSAQTSYPLFEEFGSADGFTSTDPDLYIANGVLNWAIHRSAGLQVISRPIPAFSGDARLTVRGKIDSSNCNCRFPVGIGDADREGVVATFGYYGCGCGTRGYIVSGAGNDIREHNCSYNDAWLWAAPGQYYEATIEVRGNTATLTVPGLGTTTAPFQYTGTYDTLWAGIQADGDWPSCNGTIDWVKVEPLGLPETVAVEGRVMALLSGYGRGRPDVQVPLEGAVAKLFREGSTEPEASTVTSATTEEDSGGGFSFFVPDSTVGDFRVRVELSHPDDIPDPTDDAVLGGFDIRYMPVLISDPIPYVETSPFTLSRADVFLGDIEFSADTVTQGGRSNLEDALLDPLAQGQRIDDLDELGSVFHILEIARRFSRDRLGVRNLARIDVHAFDHNLDGTSFYRHGANLLVLTTDACREYPAYRAQTAWHEYFHHVMYETIGDWSQDCGNHAGSSTAPHPTPGQKDGRTSGQWLSTIGISTTQLAPTLPTHTAQTAITTVRILS